MPDNDPLSPRDAARAAAPTVTVAPPPLQDVRVALPVHPTLRYRPRALSDIRRIVIHHTATRGDITPARIAQVQVAQGKPGITYHFLVTADGTVYWTQPLELAIDQTVTPAVNTEAVGVALAGNFTTDVPPDAQLAATARLVAWLLSTLHLTADAVIGRNEVENVGSPGVQWLQGARYKQDLLARVRSILDQNQGGDTDTVEALRRQIAALQAQVAQLQIQADQVPGLQARIAQLQARADQVGPLQQQIAALQATIATQLSEIARLQSLLGGAVPPGQVARPAMLDVVDQLPKHPTLRYPNRTQAITTVVMHHTDTPIDFTVKQLASYHVNGIRKDAQGNIIKEQWPGIAYHYVIRADGTIYWCERQETRSYHAGDANNYSLGVSLIGRFMRVDYDGQVQPPERQLPTPEQMRSASRLVTWLMQELRIPLNRVLGHKEVGQTSCPGDQWTAGANWKISLHSQIGAVQAGQDIPSARVLPHYLLFWDHGTTWAEADWRNAQNYIAAFRPTTGFSVQDALAAQHVTIVGGPAGVSAADEVRLRNSGVDVHRLAGADEAGTRALLADLIRQDTPWPGAPGTRAVLPAGETPLPDRWTVPDDWPAA